MTATSRADRWAVHSRRLMVLLLLAECADVFVQQASGVVVLPGAVDLQVCTAAFVAGLLSFALGITQARQRRRVRAEAAELAARVSQVREQDDTRRTRRVRIERIIEGQDSPAIVYQPIVNLQTGAVAGYEALSRFTVGRPDEWFAEAAEVGLGLQLELKAVRRALRHLSDLPGDRPYLSVNVSPETLMSVELRDLLLRQDVRRVVVELTEHVSISDYGTVRDALNVLRTVGVRLAVDDVGAGYASLRHIATLEPDIIKLDRSFTKDLTSDATERSMVIALVGVGHALGATIVAEGIEDEGGVNVARDLGVDAGQGWHLGMPQSLEDLQKAARKVPTQRTRVRTG
jgi:EAL domain-containing protein (putative c-di-GMP-specific phosphodiesterase class I)